MIQSIDKRLEPQMHISITTSNHDPISLVADQFQLGALTLRLQERMPNCNQTFETARGGVAPQDTEVS
jgi:hypothetical protein